MADVYLPNNLAKKYPKAGAAWAWQYVFSSQKLSVDPLSGKMRRHHMDESGFQKGIRAAKNIPVIIEDVDIVKNFRSP